MTEDRGQNQIKRRLNGWQRIWVVLTALWSVGMAIGLAALLLNADDYGNRLGEVLLVGFAYWLTPIVALYVLGWAVAWVVSGFRG